MGYIELEGWNVVIDDIHALNASKEMLRLGLFFEQHGCLVSANARGNVSTYYVILAELKQRLVKGSFNGVVELSTGETKKILLTKSLAIVNDEDITALLS